MDEDKVTMQEPSFHDRVIMEMLEMAEKRERLHAFLGSETYMKLGSDERHRLQRQFEAMTAYVNVLNERIAAF